MLEMKNKWMIIDGSLGRLDRRSLLSTKMTGVEVLTTNH